MLAIEFDNGELLVGVFSGQHDPGNTSSLYRIDDAESLANLVGRLKNIRLGDHKDEDNWWYPVSRIVRFKNVSEGEIKQLRRDVKLTDLGI